MPASLVLGHASSPGRQGHLRRRGAGALQPGVHRLGRGRRVRRGGLALADRRGRLVRRPGARRGLLAARGGSAGGPARGGARRRAGHGLHPVRGPPRDRRGRPASPACGSPVPRPSPRRSSSRAPRRSCTDPRLGPRAARGHPTVPHWLHARQPRLPDPRDQLAGRRAGRRGALRAPERHLRRRAAVRARRRGARRGREVRRPVPRPRAVLAPAQPAGPRAGRGREPAAAGAGPLPGHLRQQPRRVLHGPGGRPQAPDRGRGRRPRGLRPAAARGARAGSGRPPAS